MTTTPIITDHPDGAATATTSASLGLLVNAGLSAAVGTLLVAVPGVVGEWLGVGIDASLRLLGVALLIHGVALVFAARHRHVRRWTLCNLALIVPYPLLMLAVVIAGLVDTGLGRALVLTDGIAVGAVAMLQWRGLQPRQSAREPRQL